MATVDTVTPESPNKPVTLLLTMPLAQCCWVVDLQDYILHLPLSFRWSVCLSVNKILGIRNS